MYLVFMHFTVLHIYSYKKSFARLMKFDYYMNFIKSEEEWEN